MSPALPPSASVAEAATGGKLIAPSAARNATALCDFIQLHAPESGTALEIASGTGQHVTAFGAAFPTLLWHPTDIAADRLLSIDTYVAEAGLSNVAPAQMLNATLPGWAMDQNPADLIVLVNLLHLISAPETQTLILEAARALQPNGALIFYGPFSRAGQLTSEGDARFDAELRAADPSIGYKDTRDISGWLGHAGLTNITVSEMPANNLAFVARKFAP